MIEKISLLCFIICIAILPFSACSGGNPQSIFSPDLPDNIGIHSDKGRNIIGVWRAELNPETQSFTIEPAERSNSFHYPLENLYPNVLSIRDYGWDPNFWADIRLSHPLPGSGIDAFDARVIAVLPANPGVSMNYPAKDVHANNSIILKPDGYTKLYDNPTAPGNSNPFVAYFKDQPNRVWSSTDVTEETQKWQMDFTGFGGPFTFELIVDISTNHPAPPQPGIDNAQEPFEIRDVTISDGLTSSGGSATINVNLFDWQGVSGIGGAEVEAPDLFSGTISLDYFGVGTEPNELIYSGMISNDLAYSDGRFKLLVSAWDDSSSIHIYQEFLDVIHDPLFVSGLIM